jgi:Acyl dehydratase
MNDKRDHDSRPREFRDPPTRYLEDFDEGDIHITRGRTIEASDINAFAGLTGDFYPLHLDAEFADRQRFGSRIAHGPLTFSMAVGLLGMSGAFGDAIVALLEVQSIKASMPVLPGDTIHVRAEVSRIVSDKNPRFGELHMNYTVINQRSEEVMTFTQIMLARKRPDSPEDLA